MEREHLEWNQTTWNGIGKLEQGKEWNRACTEERGRGSMEEGTPFQGQ